MTGDAIPVGKRAEEPDWEFLARKAKGVKIAYENPVNAGVASWLDIPRLDELDPDDRAEVERMLNGA